MQELHIFDVDNTITSSSTSFQYLVQGIRRRLFPLAPLFSVPRLMLKYQAGQLSLDKVFRNGIPFLTGKQRQVLEDLAEEVFRLRLKKQIFTEALQLVRDLRQSGREVILATSAIDFIIAPLARFLGVETVIATSLTFSGEICQGTFAELAFEEDKRRRVLALLAEQGYPAGEGYFYSDSIHDLPLLEAVGHPVVVNPDRKLSREARRRDWPVRKFSATLAKRPVD